MRQEEKKKKQINGNVCLADAVVAATGLFTTPEEQTQIPWINSEVAPVSRVNDFDGATEQSGAESDALHRRDGTRDTLAGSRRLPLDGCGGHRHHARLHAAESAGACGKATSHL